MKRDYLSRLSRAARWYLPPAEAAEVLEDYQEIVRDRPEEALRRDIGTPKDAIGQLVQLKAYHRWLTAFAVLAVCVALPAIVPLWQELALTAFSLFRVYWCWDIGQTVVPFTWVFFGVGMVLSLVCFRRRGGKETGRTVPKAVPPLLVLLAAGTAFLWFLAWVILREPPELLSTVFSTHEQVRVIRLAMEWDIFIMGAIGLSGLVKFRMNDRRWGAVYVLGLAGTILGLSVWGLMSSMDLSFSDPGWQTAYLLRFLFITAAGLIGTGVSLC